MHSCKRTPVSWKDIGSQYKPSQPERGPLLRCRPRIAMQLVFAQSEPGLIEEGTALAADTLREMRCMCERHARQCRTCRQYDAELAAGQVAA